MQASEHPGNDRTDRPARGLDGPRFVMEIACSMSGPVATTDDTFQPRLFSEPDLAEGLRLTVLLMERELPRVSEELTRLYGAVPAFAPLLATLSGPALHRQNVANTALIRVGAFDGNWRPYVESLRARGVAYAKMGVDFAAWSTVFQRLRLWYVDVVSAETTRARNEERLLLKGLCALFDCIVQSVGQTYFETQQAALLAKESTLREVSTPVLRVADRVLLVPLVGEVDDVRANELRVKLLAAIRTDRARAVALDVTGVPHVDAVVMTHLVDCARAAGLMGARVYLSGLSVRSSTTLADSGASVARIRMVASLQEALHAALSLDASAAA